MMKKIRKKSENQNKNQGQGQSVDIDGLPSKGQGEGTGDPKDGEGKDGKESKEEIFTIGQDKSGGVVDPKEGNGLVKGLKPGTVTGPRSNSKHPTEKECKMLLRPYATVLAQRLGDVLKEQATVRWTGLHTGGKLLSKNAYKVGIAGETRVFSKRSNPDTPMYTVTFCIDASGSMAGQNATYAFVGAALLKDVCERLHFKVNLIAFESTAWKLKTLDGYSDTGGGTNDIEAMRLVNKTISSQDENIVFFITDGETNRDSYWDKVRHEVERKNAIIYGIGIGGVSEYNIRDHYEHGICVPEVKDLPKTLIAIMRATIKR